jgi:hypothetical protein
VVEDPVHVVDRLPNELPCDPEWPLRLVKLGDSRLGRFKLGRNRLDLDIDPLGSSRAGAAKSTTQGGVFLLELANPRLRLIEIGRTPFGAHVDVLVEQMDHLPDSLRGRQGPADQVHDAGIQVVRPHAWSTAAGLAAVVAV